MGCTRWAVEVDVIQKSSTLKRGVRSIHVGRPLRHSISCRLQRDILPVLQVPRANMKLKSFLSLQRGMLPLLPLLLLLLFSLLLRRLVVLARRFVHLLLLLLGSRGLGRRGGLPPLPPQRTARPHRNRRRRRRGGHRHCRPRRPRPRRRPCKTKHKLKSFLSSQGVACCVFPRLLKKSERRSMISVAPQMLSP